MKKLNSYKLGISYLGNQEEIRFLYLNNSIQEKEFLEIENLGIINSIMLEFNVFHSIYTKNFEPFVISNN